mgnify:CR=1 FL=1|uniref:Uncharacterized protein n=1 Tax=viral metagenome TaxID=1070528 RepID=A0A6C0EIF7_9ZZZZ
MFLINRIYPLYFFISLFIGLLLTYSTAPTPDIVITYPTPETADKLIYKDKANNCFKFISEQVNCPSDISKIKKIPIINK